LYVFWWFLLLLRSFIVGGKIDSLGPFFFYCHEMLLSAVKILIDLLKYWSFILGFDHRLRNTGLFLKSRQTLALDRSGTNS